MGVEGGEHVDCGAFPMTEYLMYGAVPLKTIKQALLGAKADGRLDRVKMVDLTNCTFDGHIYNTRRVMEECLAIKPDLIFLWDEAWFGLPARQCPANRADPRRHQLSAGPPAADERLQSMGKAGARQARQRETAGLAGGRRLRPSHT